MRNNSSNLKRNTKLILCVDDNGNNVFMFADENKFIEKINNKVDLKVISILDVLSENQVIDMTNSLSERALDYAINMHSGQYRKDGLEYITHPIKVAEYVSKFKESHNIEVLLAAAYLHDTLEDTNATYYDLVNNFGPQVASIVLELTTDIDLKTLVGKTEYLKIKLKNMSSWALVIKLCDRLDNVSDLLERDEMFRNKYVKETIEILSYLINNRVLSDTHLTIMSHIMIFIKQCVVKDLEIESIVASIDEKIKLLT